MLSVHVVPRMALPLTLALLLVSLLLQVGVLQ